MKCLQLGYRKKIHVPISLDIIINCILQMLCCADIPQPPLPAWVPHRVLSFRYQGQGSCKEVSVACSARSWSFTIMLQNQDGKNTPLGFSLFRFLSVTHMLCRWHKLEHTHFSLAWTTMSACNACNATGSCVGRFYS
jgi:hypothetical protein